jgi:hypothetical protein
VNEGVNIPLRGQISPLGAKFSLRGEVKNGTQDVVNVVENSKLAEVYNFSSFSAKWAEDE